MSDAAITTIITAKTGDVFASNISPVWAGVIKSCSIVPVSFSLNG
jgi:hypothetical protein